MAHLLLGVDVGTTGTKAVLVDPAAGVVAQASRPSALTSERPGWAEADTAIWWRNTCALIRELMVSNDSDTSDITAVATTGMVPAVVVTDGAGNPLRPAILQNDARAGAEIHWLAETLAGIDLVEQTGSALTQQSVAPTLAWLARYEPGVWAATRHVLGSYDWLAVALGAAPHVERNWAIESGLFGLIDGGVLDAVLDAAGIDPGRLPAPARPGTQVGTVSAGAAEQTTLRAGTPIVVGGADHVLSAYAAGLSDPGDWLIKLGGAGDVLVVTDGPFIDERLYLDAHPREGLWLPNGCMATSGSLIRWFQTLTAGASDGAARGDGGLGGPVAVEVLEAEAAAAEPASVICLPYFLGEKSPLHDPDLRGAFLGLHLGHGRGDLYRAVLEAIAYGFRQHAEIFAERGVRLGTARVTNGGSRSRVWKQIISDALGVSLTPIVDHPGAGLGAALAAAVGVGLLDDWAQGESLVVTGPPVEPDPATRHRYTEAYQIYRDAGSALTPISHRLARRSMS